MDKRDRTLLHALSERPVLLNLFLAALHVLAARLGLLLSHPETNITMVWPPAGVALAAVLFAGYRAMPGVFLGGTIVGLLLGYGPVMVVMGPLANVVGATTGAWLLQEFGGFDERLERTSDVLWLTLGAGVGAGSIAATLGVTALFAMGHVLPEQTLTAWLMWWVGDALGVTVFAPILLVVGTRARDCSAVSFPDLSQLARVVPPFACLLAACAVAFGSPGLLLSPSTNLSVVFAIFPPLVWIAIRFGLPGSSVAVLVTALLAISGTAFGYGPFVGPTAYRDLGVLWAFVGVSAFTALTLGSAVSERRRAEDERALERELWDALMANAPDLVYFKDRHHRVIRASRAYADAVGLEPEQVVGKTATELWPHEAEEILADDRRVLSGETILRRERAVTTAEGDTRHYLLTKVPLVQNDQVVGFFAIDRDITQRKEIEEQLAFQSMLLDQIQDLITATDLNGRITYVNRAECDVFDKSAEELIGQSVEVYGEDPRHGPTQRQIIRTVLEHGSWRGEVVNVGAGGERMVLDSRVQLVRDDDGRPVGMLGISTDITQRKAMERQLRRQERLAAVGQLAAGIAHDFRNLLTTITLNADIAIRTADPSPRAAATLEIIIQEAEKGCDLVQQMLDFGSRAMIKPEPLEMREFLGEILTILRRVIAEKVDIRLEAGDGRYVVHADRGRLQQALTNLAFNARDAMPDGGELCFTLSRVVTRPGEPRPWGEGLTSAAVGATEWIRLGVLDTGTGMTEEVREHLFEPFFTTKEIGKGTGLGLAQVYGIVRQHGGGIDVETEVGKGTRIYLYLPDAGADTAPGDGGQGAARPVDAPSAAGERILLVEDEDHVRHAAQQILEALGYEVVTARNGREALTLCASPRWAGAGLGVDVVVTDVMMPQMDGRELLARLRRRDHTLRAVAITGYPLLDADVEALKASGFVEVVRKPFKAEDLAGPIRQALAGGEQR